MPNIKVYVDSPLSCNVTDIMREHVECFNTKLQTYIKSDPDPFGFSNLIYIREKEDSIKLNSNKEPCIIISASGMMDAGRIKHHLINNISDKKNTILVVGYCSPNSLGGRIREGQKSVKIFGEKYAVNADIEIIDIYQEVSWYAPKLKNGQMLCIPLSDDPKPDCVYFVKDISRNCEIVDYQKAW